MPRFKNPWPLPEQRFSDILRWKLRRPPPPPATSVPTPCVTLHASDIAKPPATGWRVVWLGHASFLLQTPDLNLLIDPIFSSHCCPVPLPSFRRHSATPCRLTDLPPIHAVLLTHSHYDHLDLPTLRALGTSTPLIVPEGHAAWLTRRGFTEITEVPWDRSINFRTATITSTPARHFTARTPFDRNRGHWCGWLIAAEGRKIWHAGDTAYAPAFKTLGNTHAPIDLALIPIGAYQPRSVMEPVHLDPEEAVQVFQDVRCTRAIPMHWGTFKLTDEPLDAPPAALALACARQGVTDQRFAPVAIGEIVEIPAPPLFQQLR